MKSRLLFLALLLVGGQTAEALAQGDTPAEAGKTAAVLVAAQYETRNIQLARRPKATSHRWYLLRTPRQVATWGEGRAQRQRWQRGVTGDIALSRIFPAEHKRVDYEPGDLRTLGRYPDWRRLQGIIAPGLLGRLQPSGSVAVLGRTAERYLGQVDGVDVEVLWLADLGLPALVRQVFGDREASLHLQALYTDDEAPWGFVDTANYDHLDYADLGDMEADPFVARISRAEGGHHP